MSGWQPIATAPRDFGLYLFITEAGRHRVDGFHKDQFGGVQARQRWREKPIDRYTHWMPLPAAPGAV